jgi:hypothetical protein
MLYTGFLQTIDSSYIANGGYVVTSGPNDLGTGDSTQNISNSIMNVKLINHIIEIVKTRNQFQINKVFV